MSLRVWLWLVRHVVPRAMRDDWMREWRAECRIVLESEPDRGSRGQTLATYAVGALPDALTTRAFWVLDHVRQLFDGARFVIAQPGPHLLAIVMLAVPIACTVVVFQGARASVISRSLGPDIGVLVLSGLAIVAALMWSASRAAFRVIAGHSLAASHANATARNAAIVILAASLAILLIASGLSRLTPTVGRAGPLVAETFSGDVVTVLAWVAASCAMWKLRVQR